MKKLVSAAFASSVLLGAMPMHAQAATFDGNWSVLIITEQGQCDRAYRYPLRISGGRVLYDGSNNFNVSGRVSSNGAARVSVSKGDQAAQGTGRLSANRGSGTWKSPTGGCSGKWTAERRG
jgi:hypothetical protein